MSEQSEGNVLLKLTVLGNPTSKKIIHAYAIPRRDGLLFFQARGSKHSREKLPNIFLMTCACISTSPATSNAAILGQTIAGWIW